MIGNNATILYQNSSNELMQAKRYQSQISQKEFEIRLMDINNRFSFRLNKRAVKIDRSFYTSARLFI